jgi:hypothetical protein
MNTRPLLAAALALAATAHANPVTTVPGAVDAMVITFSPYDAVTSAGFVADDHILGAVPTSFGVNGSWPVSGAYAGLGQTTGFMTFAFTSGMNLAGGFINYDPNLDGTTSITALDINGDVLESLNFDNNSFTPGFYGFMRDDADIYQLVFANANIAVDNFTFGVTRGGGNEAPEPGTTGLVLASLGLIALTRRRA